MLESRVSEALVVQFSDHLERQLGQIAHGMIVELAAFEKSISVCRHFVFQLSRDQSSGL